MSDPQLFFSLKNQIISRKDDFKVVADSINYLYAHFDFETDEWVRQGIITAVFKSGDKAYEVILDEEYNCLVPHEVLNGDQKYIYVSCYAGALVTTNVASVFVMESGYYDNMESSTAPTPSVYAQLTRRLQEIQDAINDPHRDVDGGSLENPGFYEKSVDGGTFEDWGKQ